jgi:hypothetical protein
VLAFHGTGLELRAVITREGLLGRGRPTFVAQEAETARRYARARAARSFVRGGRPAGLLVTVELPGDELEADGWDEEAEPGQLLIRRDVRPDEVVAVELVPFDWWRMPGGGPWPSPSLVAGLAEALALDGARAEGQDRWRPAEGEDVVRDVRALEAITREARRRRPARP